LREAFEAGEKRDPDTAGTLIVKWDHRCSAKKVFLFRFGNELTIINKAGYFSSKMEEMMTDNYKDKFSDAEKDLSEKSAFECKSCNKKYSKSDAQRKGNTCCGRTMTELLQEGFGP
jgi:hypothetical protein